MPSWDYDQLERRFAEFLDPPVSDIRKERKRMRIVKAATELFIQHNYSKTSVDQIAKRAKVAKGTVYLYFKTKADLLLHVIVEEKKRYIRRLKPIFQDDISVKERLREWIRLSLILSAEMPLTSQLLKDNSEMAIILDEIDKDTLKRSNALRLEFVVDLIDQAISPHRYTRQELIDRATVLNGILYSGLTTDKYVLNHLSVERFSSILVDMLVQGLIGNQNRNQQGV